MTNARNKIEFDYQGWHCWQNDTTGEWGAILSRKGERPVVIDGRRSKEELIEAINETTA
jgi:hypothetical protein